MARAVPARTEPPVVDRLLDSPDASLLDLLDRVLNKGVVATGDVMLGVAGVDLIYLKLSAILCAADRVLPIDPARRKRSRHRGPSAGRNRR